MNEKDFMFFNLIFPNKNYVKFMQEITTVNLFDNMGTTIDDDGLYSQRIFGSVGSEKRMTTFAYIDLYADILHPRIYYYLSKLSKLYVGIMNGTKYAIYNEKENDFIASDMVEGETGYTFFMKHVYSLKPKKRGTAERDDMIDVFLKYQSKGTLTNNKLLVLPAGLRDFETDKDGRVTEQEINDHYRAIFNASRIMQNIAKGSTSDAFLFNLQTKVELLREHIKNFLYGKKGLINGDYFSRAVEYRNRTVITGTPLRLDNLDDIPDNIIDYCDVGILQYVKSLDPVVKYKLMNKFINNCVTEDSDSAKVYNDKLEPITVPVSSKVKRRWLTDEGLDKVMNMLMDSSVNNEPVVLDGNYMFVVKDDGKTIEYDSNHDRVYEDKEFIRPLTYGELFFLAIQDTIGKYPGIITRYPIAEQGSVIPVVIGLHTTADTKRVTFKYHGIDNKEIVINKYPVQTSDWIHGMNVPFLRYAGLGADRDGDQMSLTAFLMDDSIEEVNDVLNNIINYIGTDGKSTLSLNDSITKNLMRFMTKGAENVKLR